MTDRTPCDVPGCNRTTKGLWRGWICGKHWRPVPKHMKQRLSKFRRRAKRDARWERVFRIQWVKCRDAAIAEAFMGVEI